MSESRVCLKDGDGRKDSEVKASDMVVTSTHPTQANAISGNPRDGLTFGVVVMLLVATSAFLYIVVAQSNTTFGRGIALAEAAFAARTEPAHVLIQQIYLLGLAHQVVTFKATALFVGALIAILGGLFVLRTAEVRYDAELGTGDWKLSLGTSSPGLVMITLGCALVAVAVISKAHAPDGAVEGSSPSILNTVPAVGTPDAYDAIVRRLREQSEAAGPPVSVPPAPSEATGDLR